MAYPNSISLGTVIQQPPIVAELQALFASLPDASLLDALAGSTRRGPKGHPIQTLWRCFVMKHHLSLPSTAAMIRMLQQNPYVASACGIESPDTIPHEATFSRFFGKLAKRKYLHLVKDVSRELVRKHYSELPAFGERVALDSTTLKGWSNGGKTKKADPQAGWSVKKGTQGVKEYTYGWKLHLLVDCESELPIAAHVSAGNVSDVTRASNVLQQARFTMGKFRPKYVMADAGYSSRELFTLIKRQYQAEPIIQVNRSHKALMLRSGIWENTVSWKALYGQRTAVERAFSRLKGQRSLNHITVRGLRKVTVHCYLSLIAMQACLRI